MNLTSLGNLRPAPDRERALARYRAMAADYDVSCRRILRPREAAIDLLELKRGDGPTSFSQKFIYSPSADTAPTVNA